jgi:hypothetical protein
MYVCRAFVAASWGLVLAVLQLRCLLTVAVPRVLQSAKEELWMHLLLLHSSKHQHEEGGSGGGGKPCQSKRSATECNGNDGCCSKVKPQGRVTQRLLQWHVFWFSDVAHGVG